MSSDSINSNAKPYKLGLALSGGGARGIAHAGVLKALEEAGLKPDILAGVSAGSAVAVLYAGGVRPDDILDLFLNASFSDFTEFTFGKGGGFFRIDKFVDHICKAIGEYKNLEDLPMPVYVGVTNFEDGVAEEFHTGPIREIVRASCSIPIALTPVEINGTTYVDGGVLRNLPAWIIRDKCEKLIGSNVSPLRKEKTNLSSLFDVALRAYSLLAKSNQAQDLKRCDMAINIMEISHCKVFSLKDAKMIFTSGYANARKRLRDAKWWQTDLK